MSAGASSKNGQQVRQPDLLRFNSWIILECNKLCPLKKAAGSPSCHPEQMKNRSPIIILCNFGGKPQLQLLWLPHPPLSFSPHLRFSSHPQGKPNVSYFQTFFIKVQIYQEYKSVTSNDLPLPEIINFQRLNTSVYFSLDTCRVHYGVSKGIGGVRMDHLGRI